MRPRTHKYITGLKCHFCGTSIPDTTIVRVNSGRGKYCSRRCRSNHSESRYKPLSRFWDHVEKTDSCWNWTASCRNGYGAFSVNGKQKDAHRVSWEMHFGEIPNGLFVCHVCDNRKCVNPSHLFLGSLQDNHADMVKKGRGIKGTKCHLAKLTDDKVRDIIKMSKDRTSRSIAKDMGLSESVISSVINRKSWKHVVV